MAETTRHSSEAQRVLEAEFFARHPAAATESFELLDPTDQIAILERHPVARMLPLWEYLAPGVGRRLLVELPRPLTIETLQGLGPARLASLLAEFDEAEREDWLGHLGERAAEEVRSILRYPADRAGAKMDPRVKPFRFSLSVEEVKERLRRDRRPGRTGCFVVDSEDRLVGRVDMQDIALAESDRRIGSLAWPVRASVGPMAGSEEVEQALDKHRLADLPVVDIEGRLLGAIRHASAAEAELERASLGIQTMVGASKDERATSNVSFAVRKRLPWLKVNLVTAFGAAAVVSLFEGTIARFTALAVLLPVVVGPAGNAGAQALAVTMRGLALREVRTAQWFRVVVKEAGTGLLNGLAMALTTAAGVYLWSGSDGLALVTGVSMVASMVVAGIAGATIPIVASLLGQDPAQSSSIVLTTITDIAGLLGFLGLATLLPD